MSSSYRRTETRRTYGASSGRTTLGYWVPLTLTVTFATIGLVAWIWKERRDHDDDEHDGRPDHPPPPGYGGVGPGETSYAPGAQPPLGGPYPPGGPPPAEYPPGEYPPGGYPGGPPQSRDVEDQGLVARMSGALRRTPSPQQFFDEASRRVTAGIAAAGAAVGGALTSISEEKNDYEDHSRWSEEASAQVEREARASGRDGRGSEKYASGAVARSAGDKRKTVAVVVSAERPDHGQGGDDAAYLQEHASILSHLPEHVSDDSRVFVLIYAPDLKQHPQAGLQPSQTAPSITSSYSNIGPDDLHTPGDDVDRPLQTVEPQPVSGNGHGPGGSDMFHALYRQAQALVERPDAIMPFTTPAGYVPMLRHVAPDVAYVQATLAGDGKGPGAAVKEVARWVGQVVLVVGDETGHGGLVDSEDERGEREAERWWQDDPSVGLGKGMEVVEGLRVGEDWRRRVRGHD